MAHEFGEYDLEQLEKAKNHLMKVYEYHYGDSKMKSQLNRLETIIIKLEYLQDNAPRRQRRCVNCGNNIRTKEENGIVCRCKIDNHTIGYVECFDHWCNRWRKDNWE